MTVLGSREPDFFLASWRIRPQLNAVESSDGRETSIEPRSMDVLLCLAKRQGKVVRKERIIGEVWGETFVTDDALTHAIWELRKVFGDDSRNPRFIQTVPRRGYRLLERVNRLASPPPPGAPMVGPYQVGERLGGGAMGVVHRARDTRLGRTVALKFLAPELVRDPEAHARFLREARAASSLDHPGICTVYGIGETEDGGVYLALAHYTGETLKRRLERGPLPPGEALDVAAQIAAALDAAHGKGIVHRDLKPANVMLTADGRAKLLDFGLAKLVDSSQLTQLGRPLGTPAYMAPEQVRGEAIDHRVDLWALGVVLFQMLTGRLPFGGDDSNAVLYAITHEEPPPLKVEGEVPEDLERTVDRCLAKDPDRRYQSAAELLADLEVRQRGPAPRTPVARPSTKIDRRRIAWPRAVAAALLLATVFGAWKISRRASEAEPPLGPPAITPFTTDGGAKVFPRLSPDGEKVAYAWAGPGEDNWDLYVKPLGVGTKPIRLTEHPMNDHLPTWSPDGRRIAFLRFFEGATAAIYVMPSLGGQERKLIDISGLLLGWSGTYLVPVLSWSPDGDWLVFPEKLAAAEPTRLVRLSLDTLEKRPLTAPPRDSVGDFWPAVSPDGAQVAFARSDGWGWGGLDIWVQPMAGGRARRLTSGRYDWCSGLTWTADGRDVLFTNDGAGGPFILRASLAGGNARPIPGVGQNASFPSVRGNRMVYVQSTAQHSSIWRLPGRGGSTRGQTPARLIASSAHDLAPAYSPDGRRIAFASDRSGVRNIWVSDSDGSNPAQLTSFDRITGNPEWSPDGRRLAFDSLESGVWSLYVMDVDEALPRRLLQGRGANPIWSRDGRWIYFSESDRGGRYRTWRIDPEGGEPEELLAQGGPVPLLSHDGRFLYYTNRDGLAGISRASLESGEAVEVVPDLPTGPWSKALGRSGIYFATHEAILVGRTERYTIWYLDFESGEETELYRTEGPFVHTDLTVSPDEEWLLYGMGPARTAELMLIENFR